LEEYDYEIVYKPGRANALSRISVFSRKEGNPGKMDEKLKAEILKECHDFVLGGHRGMNKTYKEIKEKYSWPDMKREIEEYVRECENVKLINY
jgi:hypothetical protein